MESIISKSFQFGKVAYKPYVNTKRSLVEVIIEIRKDYTYKCTNGKITDRIDNGYCVSFMGRFHNSTQTDYYTCGQCYSEINDYRKQLSNKSLWDTINILWQKYHINNIKNISQEDKEIFLNVLGINIDSLV